MYKVAYANITLSYDTKAKALRNAAVFSKMHKCVVKVYDPKGNFVKSFDLSR